MQYEFFNPGDERILEMSELSTAGAIALAVRATGYDTEEDEVVELSIVDFEGKELFSKVVKPQNHEEWEPSDASGGIAPADVAEAPELYQFEEEVSVIFEEAEFAAGQHMLFVKEIIESSWVTLPDYVGRDIIEDFRECHCTSDYRNQPATIATLESIASYYGITADESSTLGTARTIAACYKALVKEYADQREAKGADYWLRREQRLAEEAARNESANSAARLREKRFNQMNGLLWVAAALIFVSLIIQLYQRGGDVSFMVICGAFAVFATIRAIANFRK